MISPNDINCWIVKITAIKSRLSLYALSTDSPLPGLVEASDNLDQVTCDLEAARAALLEANCER